MAILIAEKRGLKTKELESEKILHNGKRYYYLPRKHIVMNLCPCDNIALIYRQKNISNQKS